jgi:hypothetical protein
MVPRSDPRFRDFAHPPALTWLARLAKVAAMSEMILGIDLGTTNSAVGVVDSGFPILLANGNSLADFSIRRNCGKGLLGLVPLCLLA